MIIASAILELPVPPRDRVEVVAPGVLAPWFPVDDIRVAIDGVAIPKSYTEVSAKQAAGDMLTIVNKTRRAWEDDSLLEAFLP